MSMASIATMVKPIIVVATIAIATLVEDTIQPSPPQLYGRHHSQTNMATATIDMAVGNLSRTLFFHRQTDISGQNPCVFTCILKDGQFYDVFLMVFARYGLLGSIQGFPQPSKVRQGSLKLPLGPCGLKVEAPEAQSLTWKKNSRIWTKTNCQPPYVL